MEDLEPEQIEELKQKAIERVESEPETAPPKKSKKIRSQAQKEAFERAKLKRAANIKLRQKLKEEEKALKKQTKIKITQRVKEELEQPKEVEVEPAEPQPKLVRQKSSVVEPQPQPYHHHQPAPVNNYYYYGAPPVGPQHHYESEGGWLPPKQPKKKRGKKVRPPTPSSSEEEQSDVDEPETYKDLHSNIVEPEPEYEPPPQTKIPQFKFGFA